MWYKYRGQVNKGRGVKMIRKSISIPRSISTSSVFVLAFFLALVNCSKTDNIGSGHFAPLQGIDKCVLSVSAGGTNKEWNINDDGLTVEIPHQTGHRFRSNSATHSD